MQALLDNPLAWGIFGLGWLWLGSKALIYLFKKASDDYKKEGVKGIWQEVVAAIFTVAVFAILILAKPSIYVSFIFNFIIGWYNFFATIWNGMLHDIIKIPIVLPIIGLIS